MQQSIRAPLEAITTTAATVQRAGRLLLPLGLAAASTGVGLLVYFWLVAAVL
ncbi:hypothetical protein [Natrinema versiforme]|uniref:hypothetical protein n=1 Tax=Natrinema versiforme TaxID=88724 RepID=UPI000A4438CB|nr:hypothetical protein [Natrinema versiforme]